MGGGKSHFVLSVCVGVIVVLRSYIIHRFEKGNKITDTAIIIIVIAHHSGLNSKNSSTPLLFAISGGVIAPTQNRYCNAPRMAFCLLLYKFSPTTHAAVIATLCRMQSSKAIILDTDPSGAAAIAISIIAIMAIL